jgi:hypothetical protein
MTQRLPSGTRPSAKRSRRSARAQARQPRRLYLEVLEDRNLLSGLKALDPDAGTVRFPDFGPVKTLPGDLTGLGGVPLTSGALTSALAHLNQTTATLPGGIRQAYFANNFPTPQVNNPATDQNKLNPQDTQSETTLTLIPGSPPHIVAAFNDSGAFNNFPISFQQVLQEKFTGYAVSTNGGTSFTDKGSLPTNNGGDVGDPVLTRDATSGAVYLTTLPFSEFYTYPGLSFFRSTDGGLTFSTPVNSAPGLNFIDIADKPWTAVDNNAGPGQGNIYQVFRDFGNGAGILFTRSTNGGNTWGPNGGLLIASEGSYNVQGAYVTVGPDHAVYVFWLDQSAGSGFPNLIKMRKSTDQGATFGAAVTVATLNNTSTNGDLNLVDGSSNYFRSNSFPQAVVNPTNASDIYLVYNDVPSGGGTTSPTDKADVFYVESTNGGLTWSGKVRVNTDAGKNDNWSPSVAITPDGTHLGIFWYDRRGDVANNMIKRFGRIATLTGGGATVTFGADFAVSNVAFPPEFGHDPAVNTVYMGDYDSAVADNSFFYTTWGDNRTPDTAHPGQNPDVRFAKVAVGSTATPSNVLANNPLQNKFWNPPFDTQSETALVVVPGSTPTIVSAYNDSGSVNAFNFGDLSNKFTGFSQSTNGGTSFADKGPLPTNPNGDVGDPVLARDSVSGTIYLVTLSWSEQFFGEPALLQLFRSTDNGATFAAPTNPTPGGSTSDFDDKPWVTVDNAAGAGQGNVYVVWTDFGPSAESISFSKSTDGGNTFGPSGGLVIAAADYQNTLVQGANVVVGPDHTVYVFWLQTNAFNGQNSIMMRSSTDQGATFSAPVVVATLSTLGTNGDLGLTNYLGTPFRSNSFPQAAVNPANGHVYVVYNDVGTHAGDLGDVFLVESSTNGASWGTRVRVNSDTGHNDQWQPAIAVTPDGGHVGIFWYDRRLDPDNEKIDRFGVIGTAGSGGVALGANVRITTASFHPVMGLDPVVNFVYMGDYDQAAADNSFFYTTWGDNSNNSKGHFGKNADVRFAKIAVPTTAPRPAAAIQAAGLLQTTILVRLPNAVPSSGVATVAGAAARIVQDTGLSQASLVGKPQSLPQETGSAVAYWHSVTRAAAAKSLDELFALGGLL